MKKIKNLIVIAMLITAQQSCMARSTQRYDESADYDSDDYDTYNYQKNDENRGSFLGLGLGRRLVNTTENVVTLHPIEGLKSATTGDPAAAGSNDTHFGYGDNAYNRDDRSQNKQEKVSSPKKNRRFLWWGSSDSN